MVFSFIIIVYFLKNSKFNFDVIFIDTGRLSQLYLKKIKQKNEKTKHLNDARKIGVYIMKDDTQSDFDRTLDKRLGSVLPPVNTNQAVEREPTWKSPALISTAWLTEKRNNKQDILFDFRFWITPDGDISGVILGKEVNYLANGKEKLTQHRYALTMDKRTTGPEKRPVVVGTFIPKIDPSFQLLESSVSVVVFATENGLEFRMFNVNPEDKALKEINATYMPMKANQSLDEIRYPKEMDLLQKFFGLTADNIARVISEASRPRHYEASPSGYQGDINSFENDGNRQDNYGNFRSSGRDPQDKPIRFGDKFIQRP